MIRFSWLVHPEYLYINQEGRFNSEEETAL